jgi:hypothetical protein
MRVRFSRGSLGENGEEREGRGCPALDKFLERSDDKWVAWAEGKTRMTRSERSY